MDDVIKRKLLMVAIIIAATAITILILWPQTMQTQAKQEQKVPVINHRLETWISALEWCESGGIPEAINPKDKDGTPSYYSFQWKPATFKMYAERYQLIEKDLPAAIVSARMKDYQLQKEIIRRMVDDSKVKWENEFPTCITKKVGLPPR